MKTRRILTGRWFCAALFVGLLAPGLALAQLTPCDPAGADAAQVTAAMGNVDSTCGCDGHSSHGAFMRCVRPIVKAATFANKRCVRTLMRYYRKSTCSHKVSPFGGNRIPCLRLSNISGRISCRIKPEAKCGDSLEGGTVFQQDGCPGYRFCAEAGDTNGDLKVTKDDTWAGDGRCGGNVCGDNIVEGAEECDEGFANADAPDACRLGDAPDTTPCTNPACGDGITDTGEECDNAGANACAADACRPNCTNPACGDAVVDTGEACDDGDPNNPHPDCDGGAPDNSDTTPDACRMACVAPACGDNVADTGEQCDGTDAALCPTFGMPGLGPPTGNGCDATCTCSVCGDGVVQFPAEQCDPPGDPTQCGGYGCNTFCTCPSLHPYNLGTAAQSTSRSRTRGILGPYSELNVLLAGSVNMLTQGDLAGGLLAPLQALVPQTGQLNPSDILGVATACVFFEPLDPNDATMNGLLTLVGGSPTASGLGIMDCIGVSGYPFGPAIVAGLQGAGLPSDPDYYLFTDHCIGGTACDSNGTNPPNVCHPLLPIGACVPSSGIAAPQQCLGGLLSDDVAGAGDGCNPTANPFNPTGLVCTKGPLEGPFRSCNATANPFNPTGLVCTKGQLAGPAGSCGPTTGLNPFDPTGVVCQGGSQLDGPPGSCTPTANPFNPIGQVCTAGQLVGPVPSCLPHTSVTLGMATPVNCQGGSPLEAPAGSCVAGFCAVGSPADLVMSGPPFNLPPGSVDCLADADCGYPCSGPDADCGFPCVADLECGVPCIGSDQDCGVPCTGSDSDCGVPCANPVHPNSDCGAPCAGPTTCAVATGAIDLGTDPNVPVCVPDGPFDPGCILGVGTPDTLVSQPDPNAPPIADHTGICNGPNIGPLPGAAGWTPGDTFMLWYLAIDTRGPADACAPPTLTAPSLQVMTTGTATSGIMDAFPLITAPGFMQSGVNSGAPLSCPAILNSVATGASFAASLPLFDSTALSPVPADLTLLSNFDAK